MTRSDPVPSPTPPAVVVGVDVSKGRPGRRVAFRAEAGGTQHLPRGGRSGGGTLSKGDGDVQRRALAAVTSCTIPADSIALAAAAFGHNPVTHAEATRVRRALRRLADDGLVADCGWHYTDHRRRWALPAGAKASAERWEKMFRPAR